MTVNTRLVLRAAIPGTGVEEQVAALAEGFCPHCSTRLEAHRSDRLSHGFCPLCRACVEDTTAGGVAEFATWTGCPLV